MFEDFTVSALILWFIMVAVVLVYAVFSIMLRYHWKRYGETDSVIKLIKKLYFSISLSLLGASFLALLAFTLFS